MSIARQFILSCDGPCGVTYADGDQTHLKPYQQRQNARRAGWVKRGAADYCGACKRLKNLAGVLR